MEKKPQAVIVQFFVHDITLSSEMQKSWGVQRVCVSSKFTDTTGAAAALRPISLRALENVAESGVGGSWRGEEGSSQTCIPHSCAWDSPQIQINWVLPNFLLITHGCCCIFLEQQCRCGCCWRLLWSFWHYRRHLLNSLYLLVLRILRESHEEKETQIIKVWILTFYSEKLDLWLEAEDLVGSNLSYPLKSKPPTYQQPSRTEVEKGRPVGQGLTLFQSASPQTVCFLLHPAIFWRTAFQSPMRQISSLPSDTLWSSLEPGNVTALAFLVFIRYLKGMASKPGR